MTRKKLISIIIFEIVLISIFFSSVFTYCKNGKNIARAYDHIINEIKSESSDSEINNNLLEKYIKKFTKNPWVDQKDVENLKINISFFDIDYVKENYLELGLNKKLEINKDFLERINFSIYLKNILSNFSYRE